MGQMSKESYRASTAVDSPQANRQMNGPLANLHQIVRETAEQAAMTRKLVSERVGTLIGFTPPDEGADKVPSPAKTHGIVYDSMDGLNAIRVSLANILDELNRL